MIEGVRTSLFARSDTIKHYTTMIKNISRGFLIVLVLSVLADFDPRVVRAQSAVFAGTYDDNSGLIYYSPNWTLLTGAPYSRAAGGTIHVASIAGSYAIFSFYGTSVTLLFSMAGNRGSFNVYIDGVFQGSHSAYAPETRRQAGKTWGNLLGGMHTLKIEVVGNGLVDIDAVSVDIEVFGYGDYDNANSAVRKVGSWVNGVYNGTVNNTVHTSFTQGDLARLTFVGDQVTYVYTRRPDRGRAAVTIDGINKGYAEEYSGGELLQESITYRGLGPGIHIITINFITGNSVDVDIFRVKPCPGSGFCRAYAIAFDDQYLEYTSIEADLSYDDPPIRDEYTYGFSSGVMWIGDEIRYLETGWRKQRNNNGEFPFKYFIYTDPFGNQIFEPQWKIENNIGQHRYSIRHNPGTHNWEFLIDGYVKRAVSAGNIGISKGATQIGGEVSDLSASQRNRLSIAFTNVRYAKNYNFPINWTNWEATVGDKQPMDYLYQFNPSTPSNAFTVFGYP